MKKTIAAGVLLVFLIILLFPIMPVDSAVIVRGNGMVAYGEGSTNTPFYRLYNGSAYGSQLTGLATDSNIRWIKIISNPVKNEKIMAVSPNTVNAVYVQTWNGDSSTWTNNFYTYDSFSSHTTQIFDVVYEQLTGNALLVYSDGSTSAKYRYRNNGVWGSEGTIGTAIDTNPYWFHAEAQPRTNQIFVSCKSNAGLLTCWRWTGSAWANQTQFTETLGAYDSSDIAFDYKTGTPYVIYGLANSTVFYRTFTNSWQAPKRAYTTSASVSWLKADNDVNISSSLIGIIWYCSGNQIGFGAWNGTAWVTQPSTSSGSSATYEQISVTMEHAASKALYTFVLTGSTPQRRISWRTWTQSGGFSSVTTETTSAAGTIRYVGSIKDVYSHQIMVWQADSLNDFAIRRWSGSSFNTPTVLETGGSAAQYRPIYYAWELADNAPNAPQNPFCQGQVNPIKITSVTPTFSWTFSDPDSGDTQGGYNIRVGTTSGSGNLWNTTVTSSSQSVVYAGSALSRGVTYHWSVRTNDTYSSTKGVYCGDQTFEINALPVATPAAPSNGTTGMNLYPSVSWTFSDIDSPSQIAYHLLIDDDSAFGSPAVNVNVTSNAFEYTCTSPLVNNTVYYWKVQLKDDIQWGAYSTRWQFKTTNLTVKDITTFNSNYVKTSSFNVNQKVVIQYNVTNIINMNNTYLTITDPKGTKQVDHQGLSSVQENFTTDARWDEFNSNGTQTPSGWHSTTDFYVSSPKSLQHGQNSSSGQYGAYALLKTSVLTNQTDATVQVGIYVDYSAEDMQRIYIRWKDANNYVCAYMSTIYSVIGIEEKVAGVRYFTETSHLFSQDTWYTMKFALYGNTASVYINDVWMLTRTHVVTAGAGRLGVGCDTGWLYFDDFSVGFPNSRVVKAIPHGYQYEFNYTTPSDISLAGTWTITASAEQLGQMATNTSTFTVYTTYSYISDIITYNSTYSPQTTFYNGNKVVIRTWVADYYGRTAITNCNITIKNPLGTVKINKVEMTHISNITNGYLYEYNYTIPMESASQGTWNITVNTKNNRSGTASKTQYFIDYLGTPVVAIQTYDEYSNEKTLFSLNEQVKIMATVTDVNGISSILSCNITIAAPNGTKKIINETMTFVGNVTDGKIYSYMYLPSTFNSFGTWSVTIRATDYYATTVCTSHFVLVWADTKYYHRQKITLQEYFNLDRTNELMGFSVTLPSNVCGGNNTIELVNERGEVVPFSILKKSGDTYYIGFVVNISASDSLDYYIYYNMTGTAPAMYTTFANAAYDNLTLHQSNYTQVYAPTSQNITQGKSINLYDINGDGKKEIIWVGRTGPDKKNKGFLAIYNTTWTNTYTCQLNLLAYTEWNNTDNTGEAFAYTVNVSDVDNDGTPEIITGGASYSGTKNKAQLRIWNYTYGMIETDIYKDAVDWDGANVDSSANIGTETNFANAKTTAPDSNTMTLQEANQINDTLDAVDWNGSNVDSSADKGTETNFVNCKGTSRDAAVMTLQEADQDAGTSTMGKTTGSGTLYVTVAANQFAGMVFTASSSGEIASAVMYGRGSSATNAKYVICDSSGNLLTNGVSASTAWSTTAGSKTATWAAGSRPKVVSGQTYWIGLVAQAALRFYYDGTTGATSRNDTSNSYTTPTSPTDAVSGTMNYRQCYANINNLDYELDMEYQFNTTKFSNANEKICFYLTAAPTETLTVSYRNGGWTSLGNIVSAGWTNFTATGLTSSTYNIQIKDQNQTGEVTQHSWTIDCMFLHTWNITNLLDYEYQFNNTKTNSQNKKICFYLTASPTESLLVNYRNGGSWVNLGTISSSGWSNFTATGLASTYNIQVKDQTAVGDVTQNSWYVDCMFLYAWNTTTSGFRTIALEKESIWYDMAAGDTVIYGLVCKDGDGDGNKEIFTSGTTGTNNARGQFGVHQYTTGQVVHEFFENYSIRPTAGKNWTEFNSIVVGDIYTTSGTQVAIGGEGFDSSGVINSVINIYRYYSGAWHQDWTKTWYDGQLSEVFSLSLGLIDNSGKNKMVASGNYFDGVRDIAFYRVFYASGTGYPATMVEDTNAYQSWYISGYSSALTNLVRDINNDGLNDIITVGFQNNQIIDSGDYKIRRYNGVTTLLEHNEIWTSQYARRSGDYFDAAQIGDLNNDGFNELVDTGRYALLPPAGTYLRVQTVGGVGQGLSSQDSLPPQPPSPFNVAVINDTAMNLTWTKSSYANGTLIRYSNVTYPTSITDGALAYNGSGSTCIVNGLDGGTTYYFVAWSWRIGSLTYSLTGTPAAGKTKPKAPTISTSNATSSTLQVNIIMGKGASHTRIQRGYSAYPTSISNGTNVYNDTGLVANDTGLVHSHTYYYRAWSFDASNGQWSDKYGDATGTTTGIAPTVITNTTTGIGQTNATLHGFISNDGGGSCSVGFYYDTVSSGITNNVTVAGTFSTGQSFAKAITGLTKGGLYYISAWAKNSAGFAIGNEVEILTIPDAPTGLTGTANYSAINLQWTKASGGAGVTMGTRIQYQTGSAPSSRTQGTMGYNGTNATAVVTVTHDTHYYFSAWSWAQNTTTGLFSWSDAYVSFNKTTTPAPPTSVNTSVDFNYINLSWVKADPGYRIIIVRNASGYPNYPNSIANGTIVYNGTGLYYKDLPLSQETTYYYSLWAYNTTTHLYSIPYVVVTDKTSPTSLNISISPGSIDYGSVSIGSNQKTLNHYFTLTNHGIPCNVDIVAGNTENWTYSTFLNIGNNKFSMNWSDNNWSSDTNIGLSGSNMVMGFATYAHFYFDLKFLMPTSSSTIKTQNNIMTFIVTAE